MMRVRTLIASDIVAPRRHARRVAPILFPNILAVSAFRISVGLRWHRHRRLARFVAWAAQAATGAEIDPLATIGPGLFIEHTGGVVIGPGVVAGRNVTIGAGALLGSRPPAIGFPTLGNNVRVLAKASVLGPVSIGDNAIVGAHALVIDDVQPNTTVVGVPAKPLQQTAMQAHGAANDQCPVAELPAAGCDKRPAPGESGPTVAVSNQPSSTD